MGYGDRLASGSSSAAFPASEKLTQEKWDAIWKDEPKQEEAKEEMQLEPSGDR